MAEVEESKPSETAVDLSAADNSTAVTSELNEPNETVAQGKKAVVLPSPSDKIIILLRPAGATPGLSKAKWSVTRDKTIGSILGFIKKMLKMEVSKSLFVYVKQTFSPSADVEVGKLLDCFGSDGQLVLHYCVTEAWG